MKSYILNSDGRLKNVFLRYCGYINFSAGNYEIIFPLLIGDNVYCELRTKVNALYDLTKTWYDCNIKYYSLDDHAKCGFNPENSHSTMKDFICHINVNMRLNFNLGKAVGKAVSIKKLYLLLIVLIFLILCHCLMIII